MESGLEGRNNQPPEYGADREEPLGVSMESGLEGRNNDTARAQDAAPAVVSMESGLEGRNNDDVGWNTDHLVEPSQWSPA